MALKLCQSASIRIGWVLLFLGLVPLLARALPAEPAAGRDRVVAAALVLAWLFATPYELPWYDGLGWAVLALLAWSRFDWFLLAHTALLSLAYLPARSPRVIALPDGLSWLVSVLRPTVIPWLLTVILVALTVSCLRTPRPTPAPARSPRASAGSRG